MNEQEWNLSEILENISNFLTELTDNFKIRSKVSIDQLNVLNDTISNNNNLNMLLNNSDYRSAILSSINSVNDLYKKDDPNFVKKLELLKEMTNIGKVGIVLAKKEGKEIV